MGACILCLEELDSALNCIELFSKQGLKLNIVEILKKIFHFWLQVDDHQTDRKRICCKCWETVRSFNEFYHRIYVAHKKLEKHCDDVDPSLQGDLKNLDEDQASELQKALNDNFFDINEIKVEVNELDLLPQVEVLEDPVNSIQESVRRYRDENTYINKRLKREHSFPSQLDENDSESDVPLAEFLSLDYKVVATEYSKNFDPKSVSPQLPKRRGRPRKVNRSKSYSSLELSNSISDSRIKDEVKSNSDDEKEILDESVITEDTQTTSSSEERDSDDSWPEARREERYAEIPKRVIVRPKKYRKRVKPLVPPVRMSREEIDRRKAQQEEYDSIIAKFFNKFPCPICDLLVQNFGDMKRHFRLSHNIESGYMTCCGRKFHLRKILAEHVLVHWNPEHFKCSICSRLFHDSRSLEVHENTHTNPQDHKDKKIYQCDKCPKSFTTKAAFEYHSFAKHVPKSEFKFSCTECNKKLPTERKLKDHMKYVHDPESAVICDKCGKQMRTQSNLKKHHQLEHSDEPRPAPVPMQCEICGTWLRHQAGLKQHMKTIHEQSGGEHRCHICNKKSTNARALKRHIYHNHECERKFKCTMCEKAFKRPQDLREHTSTHTGEVLYTCPNCPMTFFSNANMYKHRQRLHRAEWESDRKKPNTNIMRQAVGATAAMKMREAVSVDRLSSNIESSLASML